MSVWDWFVLQVCGFWAGTPGCVHIGHTVYQLSCTSQVCQEGRLGWACVSNRFQRVPQPSRIPLGSQAQGASQLSTQPQPRAVGSGLPPWAFWGGGKGLENLGACTGAGSLWFPGPGAREMSSDASWGVWQKASVATRGHAGVSRMSSKRSRVEVSRAARLRLGPSSWGSSTGASAQATPRKGDGGGGGGLLGGGLWGGAF